MKKRFTLILPALAALLAVYDAASQCNPTPCTVPIPAFDAMEACILSSEHDLDCYQGETVDNPPISIPPYWCVTVENNQWFAFIASAPDVSFDISVGPCSIGGGLQAALLTSWDCVNFDFVSDCLGNIANGTTATLTNIFPLTPGEVYYLMIDGIAGDKCQYSINSISSISGPNQHCIPSQPSTYFTNEDANWTISPPSAGTILTPMPASSIMVQWSQVGTASICASSTSCSNNIPACLQVFVGESLTDTITSYLCSDETVICGGQVYSNPGFYINYVPSPSGCDSIIYCEVIAIPAISTDLGPVTLPCEGFFVSCGDTITELGFHESVCQSWQGCDSTVTYTLLQGDVLASAGQAVTLPCQGGIANLDGSASSQGSNFAYEWTTTDGHIVSGETTTAPQVDAAGTYCITVTNLSTGCKMSACTQALERISLTLNGPTLFCPGDGDDLLFQVNATSSTLATLFFQAGNSPVQMANITAGATSTNFFTDLDATTLISVWGVDATNCPSDTINLTVNENDARIEFEFSQSSCNVGQLMATLVGNFQNTAVSYDWGNGATAAPILNVTQNGVKTVTIKDNYGCFWTASYDVVFDYTGLCAYLQGTVRNDLSANCALSPDDLPLEGWIVQATGSAGSSFGTTDSNGQYWIPMPPGNYTLTVLLPSGNGFAACGNDFAASVGSVGASFTQDFLVFQIPDCPYMTVDIANNLLRRCFNNTFSVHYCNEGSAVALDASIEVVLDPDLSFVSAAIPSTSLGGNTYRFQLGDLQPGQCGDFLIKASLPCNVPLGKVHCTVANVFPNTLCPGYGPNSFSDETCRPNVDSYDPNIKSAEPPGSGSLHFIAAGTELTYNIQFQNTGTDTAYNVVVRDTLMDKFDFSTLRQGASSHPYSMEFYGQRVLKFEFKDINLPPVGTDEAASVGFLEFRVKLKDDLPPLDIIENSASIYFDYNVPIKTNTYLHTIPTDVVVTNLNESICEGETYIFNGMELTQAGEYTETLTSSSGADSIVHLNLVVYENALTQIEEEICEGESIVFNGEILTETGDIKLVLETIHGCDSLVNFSLDVWPVYDQHPNVQICNGTSYVFNGQTLSQAGTYLAELESTHGCDSTITLQLELVDSFDIQLEESICEGESYLFNGQLLTQPGIYTAEYVTLTGCDSTVALNLSVWPNFVFTLNLQVCEGDSIIWGGQAISDPGTHVDSLQTVHGCDSIIILNLEVLPISETTIDATICQGGIYLLDGQPYNVAGDYSALLINYQGCDSLVTLHLSVNPPPVSNDTISVVEGTVYNGITLLADTTITETQTDGMGCEFIVNTHFIVLPNATQDLLAQNGFEVFPNPTSGQFFVRFDLLKQHGVRLEVLDVLGRAVHVQLPNVEFAAGEHQLTVLSADWPSGVYLVRLAVGESFFAKKIVVEGL